MPITPAPPYPKSTGQTIRATDWNQAVDEIIRLDNAKVNRAGDPGPLSVDGNVGIGTTIPAGRLNISEATGTVNNPNSGTLVLDHENNGGASSIVFRSKVNRGSDYGFIQYQDAAAVGGTGESAVLTIGTSNDPDDHIALMPTGNVGIGTIAPNRPLTIQGPAGTYLNAISMLAGGPFEVLLGADDSGGIVSTMTNHDLQLRAGGNNTKMVIKAGGNVGIGTAAPYARLTLDGSLGFTNNPTPMLFIYEAGTSNAERAVAAHSPPFTNWGLFYNDSTDQMIFRGGGNPVLTVTLGASAVRIDGGLTVTGAKSGYIVDQFVNRYGATLEEGDLVVIGSDQTSLYNGIDHKIPLPEVNIAQRAYDTTVCGIVSEIYVDTAPADIPDGPAARGPRAKAGTAKRSLPLRSGLVRQKGKRLEVVAPQSFTRDELERLDRTKVGPEQIGLMVTLGAFARCKVDADIAAIAVGDLLTTSPTKGHAQKVLDPTKALGAIVGKALAPLKKGKGKIPVLVTLQ